MKKYKIYKNGEYLESYKNRWEAEEAIQQHKHSDQMKSIFNMASVEVNTYDIRR
jgi:hypothetical protein